MLLPGRLPISFAVCERDFPCYFASKKSGLSSKRQDYSNFGMITLLLARVSVHYLISAAIYIIKYSSTVSSIL